MSALIADCARAHSAFKCCRGSTRALVGECHALAHTCRAPQDSCMDRQSAQAVFRRAFLAAFAVVSASSTLPFEACARPPAPQVGACVECIGEVNGGLNACTLASPSCVSTQNDDEAHFIPPWQYNGGVEKAAQLLTDLATGKQKNRVPQPKGNALKACFNGELQSRHIADDGSEYLHIVFGGEETASAECRTLGTIDAEFIFLSGDNVVDIRAASRENPGVRGGNLSLSLSTGVQYDTNVAKREMEELRKALRWEQVPVVTDFDPRFNQRRPLFFERLYQPFLRDKQNFEDIVDK